jgi:hypothetical protein
VFAEGNEQRVARDALPEANPAQRRESADDIAYCAGDRGVLLERDGARVWFAGVAGEETVHVADDDGEIVREEMDGAALTVRGISVPGDGAALAEVVDNDREVFACDESGWLYHTAEGSPVWKRRSLADAPVRTISFNDANLSEVAEDGTVFEEVPLWGEGSRNPRSIDAGSTPRSRSTPLTSSSAFTRRNPERWRFQVCSPTEPRYGENPCRVRGLTRVRTAGSAKPPVLLSSVI